MARVRERRYPIAPLGCKENLPPGQDWEEVPSSVSRRRPLSKPSTQPCSKIRAMRDRWEHCQFESDTRGREAESHSKDNLNGDCSGSEDRSLASVTRGTVYAAQRELVRKHYEAKSKIDRIGGIGGGVSIWPAMDDMRLSKTDAVKMALICMALVAATMATFYCFHGQVPCQASLIPKTHALFSDSTGNITYTVAVLCLYKCGRHSLVPRPSTQFFFAAVKLC